MKHLVKNFILLLVLILLAGQIGVREQDQSGGHKNQNKQLYNKTKGVKNGDQ